jgi:hypothetical protein
MKIMLEDGQRFAVDFPEAFIEKHTAILGTTGAGKTSVAKVSIAEPILREKGRIHIIDPKMDWWGLRLNRKGKPFGSKVLILGGERGDYPLRTADAAALAEAFATSSDSVVFDTSEMTVEDRSQFFIKYSETIMRKNRGPLNIIIDEAHLFMPQAGAKVGGLAPRMLHAGNNLMSLGRSKGLRITLITQRPQKLHKDSLTLVQSLIALRMMHPLDINSIKVWMAEQADPVKGEEIVKTITTLKPGEGWAWSPTDAYMERMQFPLPLTFDSSKAPEKGDADVPTLEPIDMEALTGKLVKLAEEKAANDPAKLRARIKELEKAKPATVTETVEIPTSDPMAMAKAYGEGFNEGFAAGYRMGGEDILGSIQDDVQELVTSLSDMPSPLTHEIAKARTKHLTAIGGLKYDPPEKFLRGSPRGVDGKVNRPQPPARKPHETAQRSVSKPPSTVSGGGTSSSEEKIVGALLYFSSIGQDNPTKQQVAAVAGYNHGGGRFSNLIGSMRSRGMIDYPVPGRIQLMNSDAFDHLILGHDQAQRGILAVLSPSEEKVLHGALGVGAITREELARASEYEPGGGRFSNIVGRLCTLGILEKLGPGTVKVADWAAEILS